MASSNKELLNLITDTLGKKIDEEYEKISTDNFVTTLAKVEKICRNHNIMTGQHYSNILAFYFPCVTRSKLWIFFINCVKVAGNYT